MKKKGVSTYALIKNYSFSKGTLDSLKHNRNVTTATLNDICNILSCDISDVIKFTPDFLDADKASYAACGNPAESTKKK